MTQRPSHPFHRAGRIGALVLIATLGGGSATALATPQFAKDTGKSRTACHQNPQGGAQLTEFGKAFKANGDKIPVKGATPPPAKP